jgi:hypothetical protein
MALGTRPPVTSTAPAPLGLAARSARHWGLCGALAALTAFMALSTIAGALFVVPAMPRSVLQQGALALFPDFTIPALALGVVCGGAALFALFAVIAWPQLGALACAVAGLCMIAFEVVEILVVGFTPMQTPAQWPAWLQVVYLALGALLVILGARLWKAETGSYLLRTLSL